VERINATGNGNGKLNSHQNSESADSATSAFTLTQKKQWNQGARVEDYPTGGLHSSKLAQASVPQLLNLGESLGNVWEINAIDQNNEFLRSELSFEMFWEK